MKLIIDIPEDVYKPICNKYGTFPREMKEWGLEAIKNGTPIPDNATNGEVIKAMFPDNVFAEDKWRDENGVTWCTDIISDNGMTFTDFWWNAPYQKGGKE